MTAMPFLSRSCGLLLLATFVPAGANAQCMQQLPGDPIAGVNGTVHCLAEWDPDGTGPLQPWIVAGGKFTAAGSLLVTNVAAFDPNTQQWQALGPGLGNGTATVNALAVLPNGDLVAAGSFVAAGSVTVNNIARWDGVAWSPLGAGTNDVVRCLVTLPSGDLIAGGKFTLAGSTPTDLVARWNGTDWHTTGLSIHAVLSSQVHAAGVLPNGNLVVGGLFALAGLPGEPNIAVWDGLTWATMGSGIGNPLGQVTTVTPLPNGELVAGGVFTDAGGLPANHIAYWNGGAWSALDSGLSAQVATTAFMPNGELVAGGYFQTAGGTQAHGVARWNGTAWSGMQVQPGTVQVLASLALANGDLIVGGLIPATSGMGGQSVARWSNGTWSSLGSGTNGAVLALTDTGTGWIAGGAFTTIGGVAANGIARRSGTTWVPLASGLGGGAGLVAALATLANGDVLAGGQFTSAGGVPANHIARWDGTVWHALGAGTNGSVSSITVLPSGDVVVGGSFTQAGGASANRIARWNGTSWAPLGTGTDNTVMSLLALPNGDLIAGGAFFVAGGVVRPRIARWDGTTWSSFASVGMDGIVYALHRLSDGSIVAGGNFSTAGGIAAHRIARWDGSAWGPLGSGTTSTTTSAVISLASMPNGDLIAGGRFDFAGGIPVDSVARWNGTNWAPLGAAANAFVHAMLSRPAGELVVGGDFANTYVSTCPATATTQGLGCASSGGTNTLTATALPWVDATFRTRGTGLPNLALVFAVTSFTSIPQGIAPLGSHFPQSPPGCDLLVDTDIVLLHFTTTGVADSQLFLPKLPPVIGLPFFHQMVPVEVDAALDALAITATNSLRLTAGDF